MPMAAARNAVALPDVTLRVMNEADVPAVVALEAAAYQFPWSEGIFRDCLRVGYLCRVVVIAGEVCGYGIMSMGAGEAHILNLCVRADLRSRGIGRKVLDYLLERARLGGMLEAFLEVRPTNVAAIRLYQAAGFEQVGIRRGYYQAVGGREDAAVLKLELGKAAR
jgi:[ribosomal protein S18]-alanine N-acetyltransferase